MSLTALKLVSAALVLLVGLAGALLPWGGARSPSGRAVALGDSFAAGVLGSAGLVHLLPTADAAVAKAFPGLAFPLAGVLAGVGLLLVLLVEGVIMADRPVAAEARAHGHSPIATRQVGPTLRTAPGAVVLLAVLSVHSVVLGLALGAQRTTADAMAVLVAILAHKGMEAFALGASYRRSGFTRAQALPSIGAYLLGTPLGILLGAVVTAAIAGHAVTVFEAIFDSVGAGTFLYVAALDITRREFEAAGDRMAKWLAAAAGFALMSVLALWI